MLKEPVDPVNEKACNCHQRPKRKSGGKGYADALFRFSADDRQYAEAMFKRTVSDRGLGEKGYRIFTSKEGLVVVRGKDLILDMSLDEVAACRASGVYDLENLLEITILRDAAARQLI